MFKGSMVALITPFKNGRLDEIALKKLVEFHVKNKTSGLVPCGTTGESATLSLAEHERVIELVVETAAKRIPVIAGTGSNNTQEAIHLTRRAQASGADAALLIAPYYNRPMQKGLYLHFREIAQSVDLPLILYNIASRTAVNIEPETIAQLAYECKNIVGVKEASGNLDQMSRVRLLAPKNFVLISGDDSLTLPVLSIGGTGVISVVANIVPQDVAKMVEEFEKGNLDKAQQWHYRLLPLVKAMFLETNPICVKTAMELLGMCAPGLRLPLSPMDEKNLKKLRKALSGYGLLRNQRKKKKR
ncbi:MAG: 4-hydroxy-tetrahydrodipicolinate synthase [Candidatus Omnitrophica bacterium]|nr:4-hydroxy-tetrahydrodipicolinate synthase [Candidatus Omnitrophota bacterium]MBU1925402.1 4-hydroxy-tetrahydrodipicolinate synthase [Candidatus Omnitrophota bacterium]MBU2063553.1 4-hydroxy-tetrahydrodipicolinate synthase [Candidatus Omnitrophota bacterium]